MTATIAPATLLLRTHTETIEPGDLIARRMTTEQHFGPVASVEPWEASETSDGTLLVWEARVTDENGNHKIVARNGGYTVIRPTEVTPGTPATIRLHTDTHAAVVVRATKTSVTVRRVENGVNRVVEMKGPWPVQEADGILDLPYGPEQTFRVGKDGVLATGDDRSIVLILGSAVTRTDYSQ